jgi:hypothetical protein
VHATRQTSHPTAPTGATAFRSGRLATSAAVPGVAAGSGVPLACAACPVCTRSARTIEPFAAEMAAARARQRVTTP